MDKKTLQNSIFIYKENIKNALQLIYDTLNQGQQKKILKDEKIKSLFDLYEVNYSIE